MAQYLTLEEAAEKLGMSPADFKRRLRTEWTHIRPLQDGSTQRFKEKDIEELARQIGFGSEEELTLADPSSSDEMNIPMELNLADEAPAPPAKKTGGSDKIPAPKTTKLAAPPADDPLILGDQDVFLLAEDEPQPKTSPAKPAAPKSGSDSDVRLEKSGKMKPAPDMSATEEIELDVLPRGGSSTKLSGSGKMTSSSSGKLSPASSSKSSTGKSGKLPTVPDSDSSEFELKLDADSSDEFELSLAADSDEEISLGDPPPAPAKGQSGINLGKPKDSGVSLEKGGSGSGKKSTKKAPAVPDTGSDEEIDFELSLDQPGASSKKLGSSSSKKMDSDSEFELTLDEGDLGASLEAETGTFSTSEEKNDIFETDFEIPALDDDSASEAVAIDESDTDLESSSDFDLAIDEPSDVSVEDESASQVVVLDDETETPKPAARKKTTQKKKPAPAEEEEVVADETDADVVTDDDAVSFDDMDLDESISASKALEGVKDEGEEEEEEEKQVVVVSGSAPWGVFPVLFMLPAVFVIFLGGIMAYEMMHSMWGYHQPQQPATLVIDNVAKTLDLAPKEGGAAAGGAGGARAQ